MDLIFATQNENKIIEISNALGNHFNIISLTDIGCFEELPETQNTFEGNARQKALYVFNKYHQSCFADDSGLEIDALDGKRGIFSARYAGIDKDMNANIDKVLMEMNGISNRHARFRTVIAFIPLSPLRGVRGEAIIFEGIIKGTIIHEKRGENGFGYDPIFIPEGYDKTFAEMSLEEKNKISHRAIAVYKLKEFLSNEMKISS